VIKNEGDKPWKVSETLARFLSLGTDLLNPTSLRTDL